MSDLVITDVEIAKELPAYKGKGARVYRYTIEGDDRRPEDFVPNDREPKKVGDTIPGIEDSEYGPKVKRESRGGGGGRGGKSPATEKRIDRMHAQEMALREQSDLVRAGHRPLSEEQMVALINWFENDSHAKGKPSVTSWPLTSDVPIDMADTPFEEVK